MSIQLIQNSLRKVFSDLPIVNTDMNKDQLIKLFQKQSIFYGQKLLTIIQKIESSHKFQSQICGQALKRLQKVFKLIIPVKQQPTFDEALIALRKTIKSQKQYRYKAFTLSKQVTFLKKMIQLKNSNKNKLFCPNSKDYFYLLNQILQALDELSNELKKILNYFKRGQQQNLIKVLNKMHISLLKMAQVSNQNDECTSDYDKMIQLDSFNNKRYESQQLKEQIRQLKQKLQQTQLKLQGSKFINLKQQDQKQKIISLEIQLNTCLTQFQILNKNKQICQKESQKQTQLIKTIEQQNNSLKRQCQQLLIKLGQHQQAILNLEKRQKTTNNSEQFGSKEKIWLQQKKNLQELVKLTQQASKTQCQQLFDKLQLFDRQLLKKEQMIKDLQQLVHLLQQQNVEFKQKY